MTSLLPGPSAANPSLPTTDPFTDSTSQSIASYTFPPRIPPRTPQSSSTRSPVCTGHRRQRSEFNHPTPRNRNRPRQYSPRSSHHSPRYETNFTRDHQVIDQIAEELGLSDSLRAKLQSLRHYSDRYLMFYIIGSRWKEVNTTISYKDIKAAPWFKGVAMFGKDAMMSPTLIAYSSLMSKRIFDELITNHATLGIPDFVINTSRGELKKAFLEVLRQWRSSAQKNIEMACSVSKRYSPCQLAQVLAHTGYHITPANVYRASLLRQILITYQSEQRKQRKDKGTLKSDQPSSKWTFWNEVDSFLALTRLNANQEAKDPKALEDMINFYLQSFYSRDIQFCNLGRSEVALSQLSQFPPERQHRAQRIIGVISFNDTVFLKKTPEQKARDRKTNGDESDDEDSWVDMDGAGGDDNAATE